MIPKTTVKIRVPLVFDDWRGADNKTSIYDTPMGQELTLGDLHHGSTFWAEVEMDVDAAHALLRAVHRNLHPVFWVAIP